MSITINSSMFALWFFLVIFLFGLDFTLSGILVIKDQKEYISKPFLFGLWMMKRIVSINPFKEENNFGSWLYSIKILTFSYLTGGILSASVGLLMILDILFTKTLFSIN